MTEGIRRDVGEFARAIVAPRAAEGDRRELYDRDLHAQIAERGWLGLSIPEELGGGGLPGAATFAAIEELACEDITAAAIVSGQVTLVAGLLAREAAPELASEWVPRIIAGEALGCYALTEPNAGSNPAEMSTHAAATNGGVLLTGQKTWITNGGVADVAVVYARADEGITAYLVELSSHGVTAQAMHGKLGFRASDTAELVFEGVFVPDSCRIGPPGRGLRVALGTLDNGRLGIAAMAVGMMRGVRERLLAAVTEAPNQGGMRDVADLEISLAAAAALLSEAIGEKDAGRPFAKMAAMAKWRATQAATQAANSLLARVPAGALAHSWAERVWRDARVMELFEGTSEIQKLLIGNTVTGIRAFA